MVHFFGILEPGTRQAIHGAEAPLKKSFFSFADPAQRRDEVLSPAERDALILAGKLPEVDAEDRRFSYAVGMNPL